MSHTFANADSTTTAPATPIRGKATTSNDAKRPSSCLTDDSEDPLDSFEMAGARAKKYARALEVELQMTRDKLVDAMQRLEEKRGVKTVEHETKERKERERKRPPPANVLLDMSNPQALLEEYAQYTQFTTDGKGALIITIPPPTDDAELSLKLCDTLRSSVRFATGDQTGIVLYGPHRGATVKINSVEDDGQLIARSIGSHVGTMLVEGQPVDKWNNNQSILLEPKSVGCTNNANNTNNANATK